MLTIVKGRTFSFDATIYDTYVAEGDPGNVPTNHTGWTIRSQIRKKIGNVLVANLNVTFPVPTAGTVAIRHDRVFTRSLPVGDYWFDIVATDASGIDHVYIEPEPIAVHDHPTDPANATYDFVPGGGGAISHTHSISDITGLQALLDDRLPPDGGTIARYLRGDNTWQLLNKSAVGLSLVENVTLSTWIGSSNITRLGTIISGSWQGSRIAPAYLGDGTSIETKFLRGDGTWQTVSGGAYIDLTDATTVDLPTVNTPLSSALAGKAATSHTHLSADITDATSAATPSTLVRRDASGAAEFVGLTVTGGTTFGDESLVQFDAVEYEYGAGAAAAHRTALGSGATGDALFTAVDAPAARTTLGLGSLATINSPLPVANGGTGTTNGSITGTGALTFTAGGSSFIDLVGGPTGSTTDIVRLKSGNSNTASSIAFLKASDGSLQGSFGGLNSSNEVFFFSSVSYPLTFYPGGTKRLTFSTQGNVLVGTTADTGLTGAGGMRLASTTASTDTTTGALVVAGGVGIAGAVNVGGGATVAGNVGIGTTSPARKLSIEGSLTSGADNFGIVVRNTNSAGYSELSFNNDTVTAGGAFVFGYGGSATANANEAYFFQRRNAALLFGTNNTTRMLITGGGNVGIWATTASTSTTTGALVVAGGAGIAGAVNAGSLALTAPLPITSGGTGATTAGLARTALGSQATGDQLFTAGSPAVANTLLANNVVTKNADFTLAEADAGTYMRLTKTGTAQTITLPTSGISTGAEFQFYRSTTQTLAFAGSATVNGTANLASVPNNGAFALKHLGSGTYDFI